MPALSRPPHLSRAHLAVLVPQSIIMFLQSLPTQDWTDANTELLLSEAFMWSRTFLAR